MNEKKKKKWIKWVIIVLILALAFAGVFYFLKTKGGKEMGYSTDYISYGSITSVVEGSGLTKAKDSETLLLSTSGTVLEVFVNEGDMVEVGDPLFTIDSSSAKINYERAKTTYQERLKALSNANKAQKGLRLTPEYTGKLLNATELMKGDEVYAGQTLATLVDDNTLKLTQYFSYAYANTITKGMNMTVSIPSLSLNVQGIVDEVRMVSRITDEGAKLFSAIIKIQNPGTLTEGLVASASSVDSNGVAILPYETGTLKYNRTSALVSTVSGTVISSKICDYQTVNKGEVILSLTGDDSDTSIFNAQEALEEAEKALLSAEQNLNNCNAVAPIAGKVIGLNIMAGQEVPANTNLVTISDTSTITVNATVDERNISYVKIGTPVNLDQWGNMTFGMVESISLNSQVSGGVATYPIVISADNSAGNIQVNSYINYNLTASQADNCLVAPIQAVRMVTLDDGSSANVLYVKSDVAPENTVNLMWQDEQIPDGFYPVVVELGISDNNFVEIKNGVDEGTEIFIQAISDSYWG